MKLRRFFTFLVTTLALLLIPITVLADSEEPWEFQGGGWGHGIGLSQFGALGQAEDGRSAKEILQFYYTGTDLGSMPKDHWTTKDDGLLVGLVSKATKVTLGVHKDEGATGDVVICQPSDCSDPERLLKLTTDDDWFFEAHKDDDGNLVEPLECRIRRGQESTGGEIWSWGPCDAKVTQPTATDTRIEVDGREYAHGTLHLTEWTNGFHAVLGLTMQKYLYGLAEVPSSWPPEALKAQAIIGRSFALATAEGRRDSAFWDDFCGCHIRDTSSDQVYAGWSKEAGESGTDWKAAVDATDIEILTHPDSVHPFNVAKAFYSSSNGGASENNEDVWPGDPIPWLRSVKDKWSADPNINPLANWSVKVSDSLMAAYFGWDRALDAFKLQGPPDVLVRFTGKKNGQDVEAVLNGTDIATLLKKIGHGYEPVLGDNTSIRVSPYISSVTDPPGFDDTVGHLFETAIDWMLDEKITVGCNPPDNTKYCPNDPVTRGQMAVFISRVKGLPPPTGDHFDDDNGAFYESAANRLFEAGITVGCDDRRFCGADNVNRGQMAAFMVRANEDLKTTSTDYFDDDDNSIFEKAINMIAEAKITLGCNPPTNNHYCPSDNVTRGQMAAFFRRAWGP